MDRPTTASSAEVLLERRRRHVGKNVSLMYKKPLHIVRGRGQYLYTDEGERFLDCVNNVCHVGHCHPDVVKAACSQLEVLNTNSRYLHTHLVQLAERIVARMPAPLSVCFFVNSGSEANDLALRLARAYTKRRDVVTVDGAYHGHTTAVIEVSPYKYLGPGGFPQRPYVHRLPMPDTYRGPFTGPDAGSQYADAVCESLATAASRPRSTEDDVFEPGVAAFLCESALSCGGQILLPDGYLRRVYEHVRRAGGVCIADEVQVGYGRAGSHFWMFETQGVVPDIVTVGKPMGNGFPVAAVITTPAVAEGFNNGMSYFNTYGGNPVACAVALSVMDVIEKEHLQENALRVGKVLLSELDGLRRHSIVGDVRGVGLFAGVEIVKDKGTKEPWGEAASAIVNYMREHQRMLLTTDGPFDNVIKMKPPMCFTEENARDVARTLDAAIALFMQEGKLVSDAPVLDRVPPLRSPSAGRAPVARL